MTKRSDNRSPNQLRPIQFVPKYTRYAEGSVLVKQGHTHVLCNASVEESVPHHKKGSGEGWVTAEYSMLPRATHTRSSREAVKGKVSGRTQEISRLIGRALRAVVDFKKLGERQIVIDCDVIQADGGTRCASINGGYVALVLAVEGLLKKKIISQNPLSGAIAAISMGIVDGRVCLDLNYEEDSTAEVDMNFIMVEKGRLVEVQGTAEGKPFTFKQMDDMRRLAKVGIDRILRMQKAALS